MPDTLRPLMHQFVARGIVAASRNPTRQDTISIDRIHDAVADLPDEATLCAVCVPVGVPVQLFYQNFVLSDIHSFWETETDLTELVLSHVPQFIESDYLHATTHGDFDLIGQLWISRAALREVNRARARSAYRQPAEAIAAALSGRDGAVGQHLRFTPRWSSTFFGRSFFATYEDFLTAMERDFPKPDHVVTTVRSIDNVIALHDTIRDRTNRHHHPTSPKDIMHGTPDTDAIIILQNDLVFGHGRAPDLGAMEVASIGIPPPPDHATLERVGINPDRFGRMQPMLTATTDGRLFPEEVSFTLPTIDALVMGGYREGDMVAVNYIPATSTPRLGVIVARETHVGPEDLDSDLRHLKAGLCTFCGGLLRTHYNELYCDNPECCASTLERMHYACQPGVLDLPFDDQDLHFVHRELHGCGTGAGIAGMLQLGRDELNDYLSEEDAEYVLNILRTRHAQLHGHGYPQDVRTLAQGRFLDALSLRGLYRSHVRRLQTGLAQNTWRWNDLPSVLTDQKALITAGIPRVDARDIVEAAELRLDEIDAFSRL